MDTKLIRPEDRAGFAEAAKALRNGDLVAFPTETVYGLGANVWDSGAVKRTFAAKGRPSDNPLIVHIHDRSQLPEIVSEIPAAAKKAMDAFWPGPLTLILPRTERVPDCVTAGLDTVAVRMPSHPVAAALLRAADVPVTAPSANTSGMPSPTEAQHVMDDLAGKIDYVVDGGNCDVGVESTVLDLSGSVPAILRPGGVTAEQLSALLGPVRTEQNRTGPEETPKCPGMKYRHYAPSCEMVVVQGGETELKNWLARNAAGKKIGVISAGVHDYPGCCVINGGETPERYARCLFSALRSFDAMGIELIAAEFPFDLSGIGAALYNRIVKSAGGNIVNANGLEGGNKQ